MDTGADRDEVARLARAVATVVEADTDGTPTSRALAGLHEDLLTVDPGGHDDADLWQ